MDDTRTPRQIERELAADMDWARREYERLAREFSLVVNAPAESGLQPPDGLVRIENAGKGLRLAYDRYRQALQRFTEFVIQGKLPESGSEPPEQGSATGA